MLTMSETCDGGLASPWRSFAFGRAERCEAVGGGSREDRVDADELVRRRQQY